MAQKPIWTLVCVTLLFSSLLACSSPDGGGGDAERGSGEPSREARGQGRGGGAGSGEEGARRGNGGESRGEGRGSGRGGGRGPGGFGGGEPAGESGVPVETVKVARGTISSFFETNSTLEAENEVDIVTRVAGPIIELGVEEGDPVRAGQVLARLDDRELRAQLDAAEIRLEEAKASFERTRSLFDQELVSRDVFDQARAGAETSRADAERLRVQLEYMTITAPFGGLVVERYVKFAEFVQNGSQLFRLSDFDPLLAPIQVPERHLQRLRKGQRAQLRVEAFGDRAFSAEVLRIRPVVDAASGTIEVTLKVRGEGMLRPGMFSSVELEMERREDVVLVPKAALALDSLRPTVFVVGRRAAGAADREAGSGEDGAGGNPAGEDGAGGAQIVAERRELEIGLRNDRFLEVLSGLASGEEVVTVGQDGLADGTPLELTESPGGPGGLAMGPGEGVAEASSSGGPEAGPSRRGGERRGPPPFMRDLDWNDPAQVERVKKRMRERGLTDAEIEQRLERIKNRMASEGGGRGPDS